MLQVAEKYRTEIKIKLVSTWGIYKIANHSMLQHNHDQQDSDVTSRKAT